MNIEDKLRAIGKKLEKANGSLPVLNKGSVEWEMWRSWRVRHGLPVSFMDTRRTWTVPVELPPTNLDEALQAAGAGHLSERLAG